MMYQSAKITVTSLQLAVIKRQVSIVELILSMVPTSNDQADYETKLSMVIGPKTTVGFEEDPKMYDEADRMLHGCTAFHLAARFHADSLKVFVEVFKNNSFHLEAHPMRMSPLHLAACNISVNSLKYVNIFTCFSCLLFPYDYFFP